MLQYLLTTLGFYLSYEAIDKYASQSSLPDSTDIVTRKYRIANGVKAGALAILCIPGTKLLYDLTYSTGDNSWLLLNTVGSVYASTDAAALIYNPNCHQSTIIHHIVVQFFYYYCYFSDFNMEVGVSKGIAVYCVLSAYAYLVNLRLAIRFLKLGHIEHVINEMSIFIYITSCMINWIVQSYFLLGGLQMMMLERVVYIGTLGMTINDDLFLIAFLRKIENKKPVASVIKQA